MAKDELIYIPLDEIEPDPDQPRKDFEEVALQELADSIKAQGVYTPISVREHPDPTSGKLYMIIAGERRWRASYLAGKDDIPAVLRAADLTADNIYAHQLTENLHRQGLNPVELAEFINGRIQFLSNEKGVSNAVEVAAAELGVSPSWISKNTAILKYAPEIRALAKDGRLRDYGTLKKLSALKPEKRQQAIQLIEKGQFIATEFFQRKRYEKKKTAATDEAGSQSEPAKTDETPKKPVALRFAFSVTDCVKLIEKTDYAALLDRHDPAWRTADSVVMKGYMDKFKEWFVETV